MLCLTVIRGVLSFQGLRPGVPTEAPPMVFASPTKVVSEAGPTVEYLGTNKVPDLQRIFQVPQRR